MSLKTKGRLENLVGVPLVGALGGHKGRPYGIFTSATEPFFEGTNRECH
jgi:hypothetical protein